MNLIIICIDSLRKDHIGAFGNLWIKTPNLDKFFENSIVFDRFRMNGIPTVPFRRSMMLGRPVFPWKDDSRFPFGTMGWQPLDHKEVTFAETLQMAGYVTGMVTDTYHYFYPGMNFHQGFHSWNFIRGQEGDPFVTGPTWQDPEEFFDQRMADSAFRNAYEQFIRNVDTRRVEEDYFAPRVFTAAEKWLHVNAKYYNKFFLHIDCFDPHEPWDPPEYYIDLYNPGYTGKKYIFPEFGPCDHLSESEINHIRAMYAGKVTMVDRWFGHFMEKFELMGLDKNTMVLVMSDHGILLGERGLMKKDSSFLYSELLEVPMMLKLPNCPPNEKRIQGFIQECDIAPTFLRQLGIDPPETMKGLDFWPLVTGEKQAVRNHVIGGFNEWAYVQDHKYHYFRSVSEPDKAHLYDIENDRTMERNLNKEDPEALNKMEEIMVKELSGWIPPKNMDINRLKHTGYRPIPVRSELISVHP